MPWAPLKSISTMRPPTSRITLAALMSRCTSPCACSAETARQTSMPMPAASRGLIGPRASTASASVSPSISSIHRPDWPLSCSAP